MRPYGDRSTKYIHSFNAGTPARFKPSLRPLIVRGVLLLAAFGFLSSGPTLVVAQPPSSTGTLHVHFIDVGQGDCSFVQCPNGGNVLIDCGSLGGGDVDRARAYLRELLDEDAPRIDTLVVTHPDADHYNFLDDVLEGVEVGKILMTGSADEYSADSFEFWLTEREELISKLSKSDFDPRDQAPRFCTCPGTEMRVLAADTVATASPTNARSIVLLIQHGDVDVLLTGDATFDTEQVIMDRYDHAWLKCEALKIGHHGSSTTSTSQDWAETIRPDVAIVSAAFQNRFGHPRKEVLQRLAPFTKSEEVHPMRWGWSERRRAKFENVTSFKEAIYSTATNGTIVLSSDGTHYWIDYGNRGRFRPQG